MCSCVCHLEAPPFSSAIQQDLRGQRGGGGEPVAELSQGRCSEVNKESLRAILDPCHTGPSSSDHEPKKSGRWGVCVCVLHWIMYVYNRWVCNRCVTTDFCIFKWHRPTLVAHTQGFYSFPVLYPLAGWVGAASTLFVSP